MDTLVGASRDRRETGEGASDGSSTGLDEPSARDAIDHELALVESAMALIEAGASTRVTLAGLRFGRQILEHSAVARFRGRVRLEPLWHLDGSGCDISVLADG